MPEMTLKCTWWLPYRSIVRGLYEIGAILDEQYHGLYGIDERSTDAEYGRLGTAFNCEIFTKLTSKTNTIGTSMRDIEIIIRNYEDGLITDDKLIDKLQLFDKSPDDFGYSVDITDDDDFIHSLPEETPMKVNSSKCCLSDHDWRLYLILSAVRSISISLSQS